MVIMIEWIEDIIIKPLFTVCFFIILKKGIDFFTTNFETLKFITQQLHVSKKNKVNP